MWSARDSALYSAELDARPKHRPSIPAMSSGVKASIFRSARAYVRQLIASRWKTNLASSSLKPVFCINVATNVGLSPQKRRIRLSHCCIHGLSIDIIATEVMESDIESSTVRRVSPCVSNLRKYEEQRQCAEHFSNRPDCFPIHRIPSAWWLGRRKRMLARRRTRLRQQVVDVADGIDIEDRAVCVEEPPLPFTTLIPT
jgi:hypothetical protein